MKPITDYCKHIAIMFDNSGHYIGKRKINYRETTFKYKDKTYNFMPNDCSFFSLSTLPFKKKYYFYNLYNPNPMVLDFKKEPIISSAAYNNILETDLLKKLSALSKPNFFDIILQPKFIILAIILVVGVWYFASGGQLV